VANHKSSEKRARQTPKKTLRNKVAESKAKTIVKSVKAAIEEKDLTLAAKLLPQAQRLLDRLAKIGVIKRQTAGRKVSRLASQIK
jgi:small subunit ribosomal protein S20